MTTGMKMSPSYSPLCSSYKQYDSEDVMMNSVIKPLQTQTFSTHYVGKEFQIEGVDIITGLLADEATDTSSRMTKSSNSESTFPDFIVIMRGLLSNREAGVVIGKGGLTMDELRMQTGAKIAISKPDSNISDRVITIGGGHFEVAKAYSLIAKCLALNCLTNQFQAGNNSRRLTCDHAVVRILVAHSLIGTLIGKQGINVRSVEEISGTRVIALKSILPYSSERLVEIQGSILAIESAVFELAVRMGREWDRALSVIQYVPRDVFCTNVLEKILLSRDPTHPLPGVEVNLNPLVPELIYVRHLPISADQEKFLSGFCLNNSSNKLRLAIQQDDSGIRNLVIEGSRSATYQFLRIIELKLLEITKNRSKFNQVI